MPRISIYVPEVLKARLDALKDAMNLSEIACRAFEIKIGDLAQARKDQDMNSVVERLRASKLENEDEVSKEGRSNGREWAAEVASFPELQRMAAVDADEWCAGEPSAPYGFGEHLAFHVMGGEPEHREVVEFWEGFGDYNDEQYLKAFINGAQEVYREVAPQI